MARARIIVQLFGSFGLGLSSAIHPQPSLSPVRGRALTAAAAVTLGKTAQFAASCSTRAVRRRSSYFVFGNESRIVRTFSAWKPSGVLATVTKLRARRLADTSRTRDRANSATTSAFRKREGAAVAARVPAFIASLGA